MAATKKRAKQVKKQKLAAKKPTAKKAVAKQQPAKKAAAAKKRVAKKPAAKKPARKQPAARKQSGLSMGFALVEADPASFPDDLREHALELAPLVRDLRELASRFPEAVRLGPPTSRDGVAKLYGTSVPPDYTALLMLADELEVEDSYELPSVESVMTAPERPSAKALLEQITQALADRGVE